MLRSATPPILLLLLLPSTSIQMLLTMIKSQCSGDKHPRKSFKRQITIKYIHNYYNLICCYLLFKLLFSCLSLVDELLGLLQLLLFTVQLHSVAAAFVMLRLLLHLVASAAAALLLGCIFAAAVSCGIHTALTSYTIQKEDINQFYVYHRIKQLLKNVPNYLLILERSRTF